MTKMKKKYQRPEMELITTEPFYLLEGSKKSGYAIDEGPTHPGGAGADDDFIDID